MWTTNYLRNGQGEVTKMVHDFGNRVTVVTDIENNTSKQMHGDIEVNETDIDPAIGKYTRFLENIDNELNAIKE